MWAQGPSHSRLNHYANWAAAYGPQVFKAPKCFMHAGFIQLSICMFKQAVLNLVPFHCIDICNY